MKRQRRMELMKLTESDFQVYLDAYENNNAHLEIEPQQMFFSKREFVEVLETPGNEMYALKDRKDNIIGFVDLRFISELCIISGFVTYKEGHFRKEFFNEVLNIICEHDVESIGVWCSIAQRATFWKKNGFQLNTSTPFLYERQLVTA